MIPSRIATALAIAALASVAGAGSAGAVSVSWNTTGTDMTSNDFGPTDQNCFSNAGLATVGCTLNNAPPAGDVAAQAFQVSGTGAAGLLAASITAARIGAYSAGPVGALSHTVSNESFNGNGDQI